MVWIQVLYLWALKCPSLSFLSQPSVLSQSSIINLITFYVSLQTIHGHRSWRSQTLLSPQGAAQGAVLVLPTEILVDGPILRWATKSNITDKAAVAKDEVDGEDGGDFEGVWAKRLASFKLRLSCPPKKHVILTCDRWKFVIYYVIYIIYTPQKSAK